MKKKKQINATAFVLPKELRDALQRIALKESRSLGNTIRMLLGEALKRRKEI